MTPPTLTLPTGRRSPSARRAIVLAWIRENPGYRRADIARAAGMRTETACQYVTRLVARGDVEVRADGGVYVTGAPTLASGPGAPSLVPDKRKGLIPRRREDCANLRACEWAWVAANGAAQGKCPTACGYFKVRDARAPEVRIASSLGGDVVS